MHDYWMLFRFARPWSCRAEGIVNRSLSFRKLVDIPGKPGDAEHSAWLHILRGYKLALRKQWHGIATPAEFQRILVREDHLCLAQTIASAIEHAGGVIEFRKKQALLRAAAPGPLETEKGETK